MAATPLLRKTLARRVLELNARRKRKRSLKVLAGLAAVSVAHLYDIVQCKKAASIDVIEKLARALDVAPAELLRDDSGDDEGRAKTLGAGHRKRRQSGSR